MYYDAMVSHAARLLLRRLFHDTAVKLDGRALRSVPLVAFGETRCCPSGDGLVEGCLVAPICNSILDVIIDTGN